MSYANLVLSQIVVPLTAAANTVTLIDLGAPYQLPPVDGGILVISDSPAKPTVVEIIKYTSRSGLVLSGVTRGQENTTARSWTLPTFGLMSLTAGDFQTQLDSKEPVIAAGTAAQFWRGDKTWQDLATAVRAAVLTGLSTATSTAALATDSVLGAIGKLQAQITSLGTSKLDATANAASATKLATARTISLTGDATGSVAFDGTGNAAINVAVVDDSHNHVVSNVDGLQALLDGKATPAYVQTMLDAFGISPGPMATVTNLDTLRGTVFFGHGSSATGAPVSGSGSAYDAVGFQLEAGGQRTQFSVLSEKDIRIRTDDSADASGFGVWYNLALSVDLTSKQDSLGYTPIQQGTGANQGANAVKIGWGTGSKLLLQVDATDFANTWPIAITGLAAAATKLNTARKIGGQTFDGTADVEVDARWAGDTTETMPVTTANYGDANHRLVVDGIYGGTAKGFPINYGNRLQIRGHALAVTEIYHEWVSGSTKLFVRARADVNTHQWTAAREVAFQDDLANGLAQQLSLTGGTLTGEVVSQNTVSNNNNFRMANGTYGSFWRIDANSLYLLLTNSGTPLGSFNTFRPLSVNLTTGQCDISGNSQGAVKLVNSRTITLTGDATGSVSFDGSGNVSLAVVVVDDSHNHVVSNVDGLQALLDAKAAKGANSDITSLRAAQYIDKLALSTGATGTWTLNCGVAATADLTLTGNTTLAFSNVPTLTNELYTYFLTVRQGATARTLTMPANTTFVTTGGVAVPTPAANKVQDYIFTTKDGTNWECRAGAST